MKLKYEGCKIIKEILPYINEISYIECFEGKVFLISERLKNLEKEYKLKFPDFFNRYDTWIENSLYCEIGRYDVNDVEWYMERYETEVQKVKRLKSEENRKKAAEKAVITRVNNKINKTKKQIEHLNNLLNKL